MTDYVLTISIILVAILLITLITTLADYFINGIPFMTKCSNTCKEQGYTIKTSNHQTNTCSCDITSKVVIITNKAEEQEKVELTTLNYNIINWLEEIRNKCGHNFSFKYIQEGVMKVICE